MVRNLLKRARSDQEVFSRISELYIRTFAAVQFMAVAALGWKMCVCDAPMPLRNARTSSVNRVVLNVDSKSIHF